MPPRQRERGVKSSSRAAVKTNAAVPKTARPYEGSTSRPHLKHSVYRALTILFVTLFTSYFGKRASTPNEVPWKVVDLAGRGKGMIATRLIKQGERIMKEPPLFVVPRQITGSPTQLLNSKVHEISPEQRLAFFELSHADSNISEEELPLSIFQTNGISVGESGVGIFPKTARLNHACSAGFNSVYSWRSDEGVLVVHTLRDVQPGDELLTTYFDTKKPRNERRDYLTQMYKFKCSCSVCSLPAEESRSSDRRLQSMTASLARFTTWGKDEINGLEALDLVRNVWHISEEEGYWSERGQLAADAAHVAAAHSDEHATRKWAALAYEWYGYEIGKDSKQAQYILEVAERPQRHPAWAIKERMDVGDLNYRT